MSEQFVDPPSGQEMKELQIAILTGVGDLFEYCEWHLMGTDAWEPVYIMAFVGAMEPEDEYVELTRLIGGGKWKVYAPRWRLQLRKATMSREEYLERGKKTPE